MIDANNWIDLSDRWYTTVRNAGVTVIEGEGGYTQIRITGTAEDYRRLVDAIKVSGDRKASITIAVKRIEAHIGCM